MKRNINSKKRILRKQKKKIANRLCKNFEENINYRSIIGIKTDGTDAWGWGLNPYGQLGDEATVPKSSPIQVENSKVSQNWEVKTSQIINSDF